MYTYILLRPLIAPAALGSRRRQTEMESLAMCTCEILYMRLIACIHIIHTHRMYIYIYIYIYISLSPAPGPPGAASRTPGLPRGRPTAGPPRGII